MHFRTTTALDSGTSRYIVTSASAGQEVEDALDAQGVLLPVAQRAEWLKATGYQTSKLVIARDQAGDVLAAARVAVGRVRVIPGHVAYRVSRFAATLSPEADAAVLRHITSTAGRDSRCLRVHIEIFERDENMRGALSAELLRQGYVKAVRPVGYERTLSLDLGEPEQQLFAKLASSARRNIRAPAKRGFNIRPVVELHYAPRLERLMMEAFDRSGGEPRVLPWESIVEMSRRLPQRSRIAGLFDPAIDGPDGLIGFAWGCVNGRYATYEAGACTRGGDYGNLALAYAPLWDLVVWAKSRTPVEWFDLGGVTRGTQPTSDPLGGISGFKRFFSEQIVKVGEDWIFEPRPIRSRLAHVLSKSVRRLKRTKSGWRAESEESRSRETHPSLPSS